MSVDAYEDLVRATEEAIKALDEALADGSEPVGVRTFRDSLVKILDMYKASEERERQ